MKDIGEICIEWQRDHFRSNDRIENLHISYKDELSIKSLTDSHIKGVFSMIIFSNFVGYFFKVFLKEKKTEGACVSF